MVLYTKNTPHPPLLLPLSSSPTPSPLPPPPLLCIIPIRPPPVPCSAVICIHHNTLVIVSMYHTATLVAVGSTPGTHNLQHHLQRQDPRSPTVSSIKLPQLCAQPSIFCLLSTNQQSRIPSPGRELLQSKCSNQIKNIYVPGGHSVSVPLSLSFIVRIYTNRKNYIQKINLSCFSRHTNQ